MEKPREGDCFLPEDEIVGFGIHELQKRLRDYVGRRVMEEGEDPVTATHAWLLGYLYNHREEVNYQRDLENELHLAKSSVATILQTLEQSGCILRRTAEHDARQKQIILTEEGIAFEQRMRRRLYESEMQARDGISSDELKTFFSVLAKMTDNLAPED